ncbi:T9SS type A sorting domain-containing protein [bacterium]|nr:T9SS type A sorting domain-containing protein [bacterium]
MRNQAIDRVKDLFSTECCELPFGKECCIFDQILLTRQQVTHRLCSISLPMKPEKPEPISLPQRSHQKYSPLRQTLPQTSLARSVSLSGLPNSERSWMVKLLVLFASVVILSASVGAQWSDDPQGHIRHACGPYSVLSANSSIVSDGIGGAFFTTGFSTASWHDESRLWIVHVNADGYLTLEGDECPDMLRVDSMQYGSSRIVAGARLVKSEPEGTVIVLLERYLLDDFSQPTYDGVVVAKFDTLSLSGFGRVLISDTTIHLIGRGYEGLWDFQGPYGGHSDLRGGLHMSFQNLTTGERYYNHLSAEGTLRYPLPGVSLRGLYLYADGAGGILDTWSNESQMYAQRYNALGDSVFESGGRLVSVVGTGGPLFTLAPNRILYRTAEDSGGGNYFQYVFLLDTNVANLWEPLGRDFRVGDTFVGAILPDKTGGFFYFERDSALDTMSTVHRYGTQAELLASGVHSHRSLWQADALGGGYYYGMNAAMHSGGVWRWEADMTPAWEDSILVWQCDTCGSEKYMAAEGGSLIGALGTSSGFAFYHLNSDGRLGPRTNVDLPPTLMPDKFQIVSVYPNPFNGPLHIQFKSNTSRSVRLVVYDVLGREISVGEPRWVSAGLSEWVWDLQNSTSGVFYLRLESGNRELGGITRAIPIVHLK